MHHAFFVGKLAPVQGRPNYVHQRHASELVGAWVNKVYHPWNHLTIGGQAGELVLCTRETHTLTWSPFGIRGAATYRCGRGYAIDDVVV